MVRRAEIALRQRCVTNRNTVQGEPLAAHAADRVARTIASLKDALQILLVLAALAVLSGCGTINATVNDSEGRSVMLLGHDPVAYFTVGKPMRGYPDINATHEDKTYYFLTAENRAMFLDNPSKFEPQYGAFCSNGAAYGVKLGSDPTEFEIVDGRLFIFGDILGHEYWKMNYRFNIQKADEMWPEMKDTGWRAQYVKRVWFNKVPWYKTGRELRDEWLQRNPGQALNYDTGGGLNNFLLKYPGWRAREGYSQPRVGLSGEEGAAPGTQSPGFQGYRAPFPK